MAGIVPNHDSRVPFLAQKIDVGITAGTPFSMH
jgi:hypothetical protein